MTGKASSLADLMNSSALHCGSHMSANSSLADAGARASTGTTARTSHPACAGRGTNRCALVVLVDLPDAAATARRTCAAAARQPTTSWIVRYDTGGWYSGELLHAASAAAAAACRCPPLRPAGHGERDDAVRRRHRAVRGRVGARPAPRDGHDVLRQRRRLHRTVARRRARRTAPSARATAPRRALPSKARGGTVGCDGRAVHVRAVRGRRPAAPACLLCDATKPAGARCQDDAMAATFVGMAVQGWGSRRAVAREGAVRARPAVRAVLLRGAPPRRLRPHGDARRGRAVGAVARAVGGPGPRLPAAWRSTLAAGLRRGRGADRHTQDLHQKQFWTPSSGSG